MKHVAVLGSLNIDLVVQVPRFPGPGETLRGSSFQTYLGGKGGNQAMALAKTVVKAGARGAWLVLIPGAAAPGSAASGQRRGCPQHHRDGSADSDA